MYDAYPQVEEEFSAVLDQSLHPRGPDLLFDLVARLALPPGAVALDVGCGEGRQAVALHQRFGFRSPASTRFPGTSRRSGPPPARTGRGSGLARRRTSRPARARPTWSGAATFPAK